MSTRRGAGTLAVGLVLIFVLSLVPATHHDGGSTLRTPSVVESTPLGQLQTLTIGSWPDGANQRVEVSVPDGHAIKSLDIDMQASTLASSLSSTLTEAPDFANGAVYDGVSVNGSSLAILPSGAFWDFENPAHGWTLGGGGNVWKVGYDSVLGQNSGVFSGANALYTYDGNYPNNMGQFWATSPTIDCSGCSGSWELNYMRKLGIESRTWDLSLIHI